MPGGADLHVTGLCLAYPADRRRTRPVLPPTAHCNSIARQVRVLVDTEARRGWLEAPICTWQGYVPRIPPTDVGLGLCYRDASTRALKRFDHETREHHRIVQLPINVRE